MVGLALQLTTQNCLGCYSNFDFGWQISRKTCNSSPSYKIKSTMYIEYYITIIATQLLQIATQFVI